MKTDALNTQTGIATTLKQLRAKARLTQEELARRSGVGLRFGREVEQANATPSGAQPSWLWGRRASRLPHGDQARCPVAPQAGSPSHGLRYHLERVRDGRTLCVRRKRIIG